MPVRLPICVAYSALYGTVVQLELRNLFVTKPIIDEHRKHIEIIFRHLSRRLLLRSFRIQEVKKSLLGELSGDPTQNIVCVCFTLLIMHEMTSVAVLITLVVLVSLFLVSRFVYQNILSFIS